MAPGARANLCHTPAASLDAPLQLERPKSRCGGLATRLHRGKRRSSREALEELEEQWGNRYPGVIRIWRQAWEEFTPFLKVPARASQGRVHNQRRRKRPLSTTESHQNTGAFPHRPIRSQAAAPRRQKHNQQTRRKPRHRHPRLENSPKPTRNPLPQPTKPNPLKTYEPTPSHRRFDKPLNSTTSSPRAAR